MRKKWTLLSLLLVFVLILTSCAPPNEIKNPEDEVENPPYSGNQLHAEDFFMQNVNSVYYYSGIGNEYAQMTVYTDYVEGTNIQQRIDNGGTEIVKVYKVNPDNITMVFQRGETYFRENFIGIENASEVIIQMPTESGNSWINHGIVKEIITTEVEIETPSGNYMAIEVVYQNGDWLTKEYYSKGIGLVKVVYDNGVDQIISSLEKIEEKPFVQNIDFYYPNIDNEKYYYKSIEIEFLTNDITSEKIVKAYKDNMIENAAPVLNDSAYINTLYLGEDGVLNVDLNSEFVTNMNAGSSYEVMILQSLTNTLCKYYAVDKLNLTVEGYNYESGHILIEEGQYLTPYYENQIYVE